MYQMLYAKHDARAIAVGRVVVGVGMWTWGVHWWCSGAGGGAVGGGGVVGSGGVVLVRL